MTIAPPVGFAAVLIAALLLPSRADRLRGALGLPAFALGAASLPFLADIREPDPALWISGALLLLGPSALLIATWRARARLRAWPLTVSAVAVAVALGVAAAWPLLTLGGVLPAVLSAGALGLGAAFVYLAAATAGLGRLARWLHARAPDSWRAHHWGTLLVAALTLALGLASLRWSLWLRLWQPAGIGLGAALVWWAAATRRPALACAGAGFAICFVPPEQAYSTWVGFTSAALLPLRFPLPAALLAAVAGFVALPGLLDAEVLLTVVAVGGASALLATLATEDAGTSAAR